MIVHSPDSEYSKELQKWEALPGPAGPGLRPYVKHEYPHMLYRAERSEGQLIIADTTIVDTRAEADRARLREFYATPTEAFAAVEAAERDIAKQAANRAWHDRRMSPQAQAAVAAVEAQTSGHLATMPVHPLKRRRAPRVVEPEV